MINTLIILALYLVSETILSLLKGTPAWLGRQLFSPVRRLWKERVYLRSLARDDRYARWKPATQRYVALRATHARESGEHARSPAPQPLLDLLNERLRRRQSVLVLGDPGAGKTTAFEALTYQLAGTAYRRSTVLWFVWLAIAAGFLLLHPLIALLWLGGVPLALSRVRLWSSPFFLELRTFLSYRTAQEFLEQAVQKATGDTTLLKIYGRCLFLLDGTNEIHRDHAACFLETWRTQDPAPLAFFSSRSGEKPATLDIPTTLDVCELDDDGVREYLRVYLQEQAERQSHTSAGNVETNRAELQRHGLLDPDGIGRNPYWLRMLVLSGLRTRNRGALFLSFARELLRREIEVKPEERKRKPDWAIVPLEVEMDALAALALAMNRKDLVGFKGEVAWAEALEIIERALKGRKETPSDVLGEAAAATLVRWSHNECIEFCHQLVQEFFAAYALRSPGRWDEAIACCQNLWWWETLFMLGGLAAIPETGGSPEKWAALTRRVLGDGQSEPCVFVAVGLLGSVEDPAPALGEEITAALVAHTEVPLTEGQQRAAQELGRILGDEAVEMFRALLRDPDRRIKGAALLCALTRPQATTVLLFGLRGAYSSVLVPVGAPAVAPLIAALGDKREDVQQEAAEALGILGDARAVEPLIAALGDESEFVRRKVAEALGRLGDAQAIEPLSAALGDEREDVRWEAAAALGRLGDARAVEPLSAALGDEDWSVRQSAAAALGRLGGAAVEPLIAALGDNYWSVRGKAAEALGRLEDARAVEPLINALGDENRFVRGKTAVALRTLTGQNFGRDAARWQRWWREQQRGV